MYSSIEETMMPTSTSTTSSSSSPNQDSLPPNSNNNNDELYSDDPTPQDQELQQQPQGWKRDFRDHSNVFRQFFGCDILTFPYNLMMVGMVMGPIASLIVATLEYRGILSLLRVKNHYADSKKLVAFGQLGERTLGHRGSWAVDMIVLLCQWFASVAYASFSGHNFNAVVPNLSYNWCVVICVSTSFVLSLLQSPFFLAKLSIIANLFMFASVVTIFSQIRFGKDSQAQKQEDSELLLFTTPMHTAIGFTLLASNLGGITTTLDVERTMTSTPGRYHMILRRMMTLALFMLITVGLIAYASFGAGTCGVLSLSLPEGPARTAAEVILIIGPTLESVLNSFQIFVIASARLKEFPNLFSPTPTTLQFVLLRLIGFASAAAFSIGIPFYGMIISIAGAFGYGVCGFVVPPLMELALISQIEKNNNDGSLTSNATTATQRQHENQQQDDNLPRVQLDLESSSPKNDTIAVTPTLSIPYDSEELRSSKNIHQNPNGTLIVSPSTTGGNASISTLPSSLTSPQSLTTTASSPSSTTTFAPSRDSPVTPSRKTELYAILILGVIIIICGGSATIRDIIRKKQGLVPEGC